MSRHESRAALGGLSLTHVGGGALAAVTAALAASRLGVTGTVLGAAFGSVISTIAGALYTHSLDRAQTRVVATRARIVRAVPGRDAADPTSVPSGVAGVSDGTDLADSTHQSEQTLPVLPSQPTQPSAAEPANRRHLAWGAALGVAAVVFAVAMGAISLVEAALGHPVSGSVSGSPGGTTVGRVFTNDSDAPSSEPTEPSSNPTESSPEPGSSSGPTDTPTPSELSVTPSPESSVSVPGASPPDTAPTSEQSAAQAGTPDAS